MGFHMRYSPDLQIINFEVASIVLNLALVRPRYFCNTSAKEGVIGTPYLDFGYTMQCPIPLHLLPMYNSFGSNRSPDNANKYQPFSYDIILTS